MLGWWWWWWWWWCWCWCRPGGVGVGAKVDARARRFAAGITHCGAPASPRRGWPGTAPRGGDPPLALQSFTVFLGGFFRLRADRSLAQLRQAPTYVHSVQHAAHRLRSGVIGGAWCGWRGGLLQPRVRGRWGKRWGGSSNPHLYPASSSAITHIKAPLCVKDRAVQRSGNEHLDRAACRVAGVWGSVGSVSDAVATR